ncbi:MAG: hypothetical protein V7782_14705, partial [Psychromonas sp.]
MIHTPKLYGERVNISTSTTPSQSLNENNITVLALKPLFINWLNIENMICIVRKYETQQFYTGYDLGYFYNYR